MPIKVMTVFGTRPDAIKMAPVVLELQKYPQYVDLVIAVTGQHREMLQQVLDIFGIEPKYNLNIMSPNQTLAQITTRALNGLSDIISQEKPDIVLAQGDTTTTFVASLAAFYNKVAIGHVEAGLRTDNKYDPFPEEINRRLTGVLADLHFAPTDKAKQNLLSEGISEKMISVTGNTVIDALLSIADREYSFDDPVLSQLVSTDKRIILVTAHRRENWGDPMLRIANAVKSIAEEFCDVEVVFSLHKNPVVRDSIISVLDKIDNVHLIEPPDYVPFVHLLKRSYLVLTDSGGVQEEAPSLGKPVLVMRETTERPEGVDAGTTKLVGTDIGNIINSVSELLTDHIAYNNMSRAVNPYGDGSASVRICKEIFKYFKLTEEINES
ncbi:MAG: non-hydrolyzing UDP-N-acetylglucosamine 2-epimerase [Armatimonadota bacterium]